MGDNNDSGGDAEFSAFEAAGEVEVGESNLASEEKPGEKTGEGEEKAKEKAPRRGPPKPAQKSEARPVKASGEEDEDENADKAKKGEEEDEDEDADKAKKKTRQSSDRIRELSRRLRDSERLRNADQERLGRLERALENRDLPNRQGEGKSRVEEVPAPDPTDTEKYPLGHLDDRYIEDKLEWLAEDKAARRADAVLHRQQEDEQTRAAEQSQRALLEKVDDLAKIGDELYDDFQESVVDAGMRGDWDLSQATFEAAHEVDNGAQILYELSQDKKEASRVAKLSNYQQMKFVEDRNTEIAKTKAGRKIPKAGEPPQNQARGANSRTQINPATENLDDFEKQWQRDEKGKS